MFTTDHTSVYSATFTTHSEITQTSLSAKMTEINESTFNRNIYNSIQAIKEMQLDTSTKVATIVHDAGVAGERMVADFNDKYKRLVHNVSQQIC